MSITAVDPIHLNLPEIVETDAFYDDAENVLYVYCEAARGFTGPCPKCGCFNYHGHGHTDRRRIHDLSFEDMSVDIMLRQRRFKCQEKGCEETFVEPFDFVNSGYWMTKRLVRHIARRALIHPFIDTAAEFGITIPTVASILTEYGKELDANREIVAPRVLGIDEVHIGGKMRGVFIDVEKSELLEITPDNKIPTMLDTIQNMKGYLDIEIATMDMSNGYRNLITDHTNASIIVDRFHVVRYIYSAADAAKRIIIKSLREQLKEDPDSENKRYKEELLTKVAKDVYMFKFSDAKLSSNPSRAILMSEVCSTFPEFNTLRNVKLYAEAIYNSENAVDATARIQAFPDHVPKGPVFAEFRKFGRMVNRWLPEIVNYFIHGKKFTNSTTEGLNAYIKQISGSGRGYKYETLRIKCLHHPKVRVEHNLKSRKKPEIPYSEFTFGFSNTIQYNSDISRILEYGDEIF